MCTTDRRSRLGRRTSGVGASRGTSCARPQRQRRPIMRHTEGDEVGSVPVPVSRTSERDICDSYLYLLGRLLVLRQERFDFISGSVWNQLNHRDVTSSRETPNLDVTYSEAWIAVDEYSCTILDVPRIVGRYYTIQVLNPWGETVANINERTFPDHPCGSFAFCLKGAHLTLPIGARRIDLPGRKARVLIRVELGPDPEAALALQRQITMRTTGKPAIPDTIGIPLFTNDKLPGVEAFDHALAVLATEQDINPGTDPMQAKVRAIAALARNEAERNRIDRVIREQSWGLKQALYVSGKDWVAPRIAGNYGTDWRARTAANLFGMWSNSKSEVATFEVGGGTA